MESQQLHQNPHLSHIYQIILPLSTMESQQSSQNSTKSQYERFCIRRSVFPLHSEINTVILLYKYNTNITQAFSHAILRS